jgi:hypothetical protein
VALAVALSSSLIFAAGAASAQTDQDKAAARSLATQGADALGKRQYAQALDLVSRAQALYSAPTHLLMIAQAQVGLGHYVAAQETYLKLIRMDLPATAPPAFKSAQSTGKDELAAVEGKIAQLRIILDGIGSRTATVKMDGQPVSAALIGVYQPVDPGKHDISVDVGAPAPATGAVDLGPAEKKDIHITVPAAAPGAVAAPVPAGPVPAGGAPPSPTPTPPPDTDTGGGGFFSPLRYAGIGVGAAGLVVGGVVGGLFFAKSGSSASAANTLCGGPPPAVCPKSAMTAVQADESSAASQKTIAAVGLGAGGGLLAVGVVLIVVGKPKAAVPASGATVEPWFTGTAAGLRGTF